jgi:hypothetical protein
MTTKTVRPGRPPRGSHKYLDLRVQRVEKSLADLPIPVRRALLSAYCPTCALRLSPAYPHICPK